LALVTAELRQLVTEDLAADGIAESARSVAFEADLRFMRQQFELSIPCNDGFDSAAQRALSHAFTEEYQRRYGQGALVLGAPVELVSLRAIGSGRTVHAELARAGAVAPRQATPVAKRRIWVGTGAGVGPLDVDVISTTDLLPGHEIAGPALLDGSDTTIWIPPRVRARVDEHRTIDMQVLP
jgi:N-methylhydantoinase A